MRWTATNRSVYAVGPTNVDPRTGEILNADILVVGGVDPDLARRVARVRARRWPSVQSAFCSDSLRLAGGDPSLLCRFGEGLDRQGTVARALLAARGVMAAGGAAPREYIGQALKALVMHEVGHTLGLRHNFRGSAGVSRGCSWPTATYTERHGHGVSVMDYSPPALVARSAGGRVTSTRPTIGSYDRWAVTYGYAEAGRGTAARPAAKGAGGGDRAVDARGRDQRAPGHRLAGRRARDTSTPATRTPASARRDSIPPSPATT